MVVLEWGAAPLIQTQWVGASGETLSRPQVDPASIAAVIGPPGEVGQISSDPENQLEIGQDGGLFVSPPKLSTSQW